MRILVVNPNISESVTELIQAEAQRSVSPGTTLTMATAPFGVAYIETRFEALVGGYATACAIAEYQAEHQGQYDGVVVAAFGDPGLAAIKELCNVPVVGMTEAALASACLLGQRFSIIAISHRIEAWYRECVAANGLSSRLASVRSLQQPLRDIGSVQEDHAARLEELSLQAVREDGADVIIVAGAPLAGLSRTLKDRIPVPVVDGVSSAIRHCESLIALGANGAAEGSFARPPRKPNRGLPPALSALLA
jgi:Asp/Glu/hydantoin racemase